MSRHPNVQVLCYWSSVHCIQKAAECWPHDTPRPTPGCQHFPHDLWPGVLALWPILARSLPIWVSLEQWMRPMWLSPGSTRSSQMGLPESMPTLFPGHCWLKRYKNRQPFISPAKMGLFKINRELQFGGLQPWQATCKSQSSKEECFHGEETECGEWLE